MQPVDFDDNQAILIKESYAKLPQELPQSADQLSEKAERV
jgi:hypothetical protein